MKVRGAWQSILTVRPAIFAQSKKEALGQGKLGASRTVHVAMGPAEGNGVGACDNLTPNTTHEHGKWQGE